MKLEGDAEGAEEEEYEYGDVDAHAGEEGGIEVLVDLPTAK